MRKIIRDEIVSSNLVAIADDKGNRFSYTELEKKAEILSQYIEERSLIFVLCDHHTETVVFLYEILYLNRVPLILSSDINLEMLNNLIKIYQPQYIYCDIAHEICGKYEKKNKIGDTHTLLLIYEEKNFIHPDVALLLSTSGTTGSPKLVKLSYDNLYNSSKYVCLHMDIQEGQKGICPLSMSYVYGLMFCIWHWHCGATLLITSESVLSNKFNDFYKAEKANNFAGTPYTYQMLQRIKFWDSEKLGYLHWAMSAGMQMSDKQQLELISIMQDKFWIMYGQTECTGFISAMNFDKNNIKLGSVGKRLENIEIWIDDKVNELILKSDNVCMGYANNIEQLQKDNKNQGILHTGDVGYIDEDMCIYLRGRLTRYVKILGKRTSLDDVEKYLKNKFIKSDFACIEADDSISIFYTNTMDIKERELLLLLERNMKIPRKFVSCIYIEKLPMNNAGKVMYAQLKEVWNERKDINDM